MSSGKQKILLFFLFSFSIYCSIIIGQSWDEGFHLKQGKITLDYILSLGRIDNSFVGREYYAPIYWSFQYFLVEIFPSKYQVEISHLSNLTFSLCTIIGVAKIGKELFNKQVGKIIFLILFFYPIFFGHMSFNPKDTILAFSHVWITYLSFRYLKKQNEKGKITKYLFYLGLLAALATGIQLIFLASMLPLFLFLFLEIFIYKKIVNSQFKVKKFLYDLIKAFLFFYIIIVLFWIDTHSNILTLPFKFIAEAFTNEFTGFKTGWPYNMLNENYFYSIEAPKNYFFIYIFYKSPEYILLCYLLFFIIYLKKNHFFKKEFSYFNYKLLFLFFLIIYPGLALYINPYPVYDGIRLFYWSVPYLCIIPGITIYYLIKNINYFSSKVYFAIILPLIILLLYNFITITPYQYTYLNIFSGSSKDKFRKFENDYWGASILELINKTKFNPENTIKISVCGVSSKIAERYFKKKGNTNIVFSHPKESEFIIMTNRTEYNFKTKKISNCFDIYEGKDILQVKRNGLLLSTIRKIN